MQFFVTNEETYGNIKEEIMIIFNYHYSFFTELCTSCAFFYTQYCNRIQQITQTQQPQSRPDDTDSFTPRVRSDKRSITVLLGKSHSYYLTEYDVISS